MHTLGLQKWFSLVLIAIFVTGLWPTWAMAAPVAQEQVSPNLLIDGDFEAPPTWPMQDGIGEVQVAPGWRAWYLDYPPSYIVPPASCYDSDGKLGDNGCFWMRPEFRDTTKVSFAYRVRSGERAQKYFSFGRMHEAGLYQQVHNIPVGAQLRFSIYIQAWMCSDVNKSEKCKGGLVSDAPSDMHLRIGIDPTGGTDPFSGNIVWSPELHAWDRWTLFQVEAVAQSSTVTVFTHSRPEWDWTRMNNDIYLDDAELVIVGAVPTAAPTPAAQVPQPPPQPQPQPQAQPVTRPDGAVIHKVVAGDTLLGIALAYGVTVNDLVRLNNLNPGDYLQIGQELVVKAPAGVAPTAPPPPPTATPPPPAPASTPSPTVVAEIPVAAPAGLCVVAFEDQNMNTLYDNNEGLVANTQFDVTSGATIVASHITDGHSEPYCFLDLKPGTYTVAIKPAGGYRATSVEKTGVALAAGQTVNVAFGSISTGKTAVGPSSDKAGAPAADVAQKSGSSASPGNSWGILIAAIGVIVLVVVTTIGAVMSRRR